MVLLGLCLDLGYPVPCLVHLVLEGGRLGLVEAPEVLLRLKLVLEVFPGDLVHRASSLHLVQLLLVGLGALAELCQSFETSIESYYFIKNLDLNGNPSLVFAPTGGRFLTQKWFEIAISFFHFMKIW